MQNTSSFLFKSNNYSIVFAHTHAKTSLKHKPLQPNSFVKRIEIIILPISSANPAITVILDLLSPCNEQR